MANRQQVLSHPMRVRGLKRPLSLIMSLSYVAPHAGAWIETVLISCQPLTYVVAPHAGAWIETLFKNLVL